MITNIKIYIKISNNVEKLDYAWLKLKRINHKNLDIAN